MANTIRIDFIGMCVFIADGKSPTKIEVGLLDERRHVHLISYRDKEGIPVLKGLFAGDYSIKDHPQGSIVVLDDEQPRLPDLAVVSAQSAKTRSSVRAAMRVRLALPGGTNPPATLRPQLPTNPNSEGPWKFSADISTKLTDRTTFVCETTQQQTITLMGPANVDPIGIDVSNGVFSFAIIAVDEDLGTKIIKPEKGFPLCEFQLLYACTVKPGAIPIFDRADPDAPICPQAIVIPAAGIGPTATGTEAQA